MTPAAAHAVGARLAPGWRRGLDPEWLAEWRPAPFALAHDTTEVVTLGAGPALLMIPPLPGYKEAFVAVAHRLARRFRVVSFDLRPRAAGAGGWSALDDDLARVANAHVPEGALVFGHSLGGALAMRWAIAHPERVRGLVLSSSFARVRTPAGDRYRRFVEQPFVLAAHRWLPERAARRLARSLAARGAWVFDARCDERVLDLVAWAIRRVPITLAARCVRLAFAHDVRADLGAIRTPTLVLVGERETRFARGAAEELAAAIPGASLRVSPGVAHLHPLSAAEWLADTVTAWAPSH